MKTLRSALILSVALGLSAGASATTCPGPDAGGYTCTINPAGAAFTTTTSGNLLTCDDCAITRAIGFTFNHYGVAATTVNITSNGYIQVGGGASSIFAGFCTYPTGSNPGYVGRYDDLYLPGGGTLTDGVSGVAPNRIYSVQWNNVPHYPGGFGFTTFQIQLHENGGTGSMARIVINVLGNSTGDVAQQNIAMTQGLDYDPCNGVVATPLTIQFSKPASTGTGCDLTPIEAKLDDGTRWTNDAERNTQTTTINNNTNTSNTTQTNTILNSINPNIARVEAKLDDGTRFTSDTERTNMQNAIVGEINQNETKIDRLEAKLDDERRFTDDAELGALQQTIDALEVKLDNLAEVTENLRTQLQIEAEHALGEDTNVNRPMAIFVLPAANGGRLEEVRDLVDRTINNMVAAGCGGANAGRAAWDAGNANYALGKWDAAYVNYADAYKTASTAPCN
jgi:hypothetical protein